MTELHSVFSRRLEFI